MTKVVVRIDELTDNNILELLNQHRQEMLKHSPPESVHALKAGDLRRPEIQFWSAWIGQNFAGCGALKELSSVHGEIKSMKTKDEYLRKGVARALLNKIVDEGRIRNYEQLSLETGSMGVFIPARRLYRAFGFKQCAPFADYFEDPNSTCMSLKL